MHIAQDSSHSVSGRAGSRKGLWISLLFFLSLWLLYGVTTNSSNLREFNLQQAGVEAIGERGQFYVEGSSTRELKIEAKNTDAFEFNGHRYAAKQPGQFLFGALFYYPLHLLGLSFGGNFLLASALVTFFTGAAATAFAALIVFLFAYELFPRSRSLFVPLAAAITFGLGTTAFAYSGISHHDAIASGLLIGAFYLLFKSLHRKRDKVAVWLSVAAGILLGLTVTTSMLPFPMVVATWLYALSSRRWQLIAATAVGTFLGLVPLFVYDTVSFSNPLLLPNIAGKFSDTYFLLDAANFVSKLKFYATLVVQYCPVILVGLVGIGVLPKAFRREQLFVLTAVVFQAGYVFNIETTGGCEFGPRYLLPILPFVALGLTPFLDIQTGLLRRLVFGVASAVVAFSILANALGALYGAMYCNMQEYAVPSYLNMLARGEFRAYPLAPWLALPLCIMVVLLIVQIHKRNTGAESGPEPGKLYSESLAR